MRAKKMLARALGVEGAVVESVDFEAAAVVLRVRPRREERKRCSRCRRRCPLYDSGEGVRRWRAHDVGLMTAYVEAKAPPRVACPEHGVIVANVPWARRASRFTIGFENTIAWLAVRTDKTTVSSLLRVAWRTVGAIIARVSEEARGRRDAMDGVTRIGIDEVSYRKGHRYLTVVVDHDTGRLLWAQPGRDEQTVRKFFEAIGPERRAAIQLVSADAAAWIGNVVREQCPNAMLCIDPFHVVSWATKALDEVRRELWNDLRSRGEAERAKALKGSRWALVKNPENLSRKQRRKLRDIERENQRLYRAYLLKEQLREVFRTTGVDALNLLNAWLAWACRSKLEPFKKVARAIRQHRDGINFALLHVLSNARIEAANGKLRLLTRMAFGFHSHAPLIGLAMLKLGGLCPPLPQLK